MAKCIDFLVSVVCPQKLPPDRLFNLSNTFRVYVLWFFIVAIFLTAGLAHGLGKFHGRTVVPVPEQMYYMDWFSSDFCSDINVTTEWPLRVNAYLLDRKSTDKTICNQSAENIAGRVSKTIPAEDIYTMKLYVQKGDRISAQICMSNQGKIYIFKREMDFLRCILGESWQYCGITGPTRYRVDSNCKDYDTLDNPYYMPPQSISDTGEYFFVFYNSLSEPAHLTVRFWKTIFNKKLQNKAEQSCHDTYLCRFNLGSISASKAVCFEAIRYTPFPDSMGKDVQVTCKPRLWLYFMLFFILPIILAVLGTVLICTCCSKNGSPRENATDISNIHGSMPASRTVRSSPSTPLGNQGNMTPRTHPTYSDTNLDDIHVNDDIYLYSEQNSSNERRANQHQDVTDAPPSYEEVMKGVLA